MSTAMRESLSLQLAGVDWDSVLPRARAELAAIQDRIRAVIGRELLLGEAVPLGLDASLLARGIIDSARLPELAELLRRTFGITLDESELTRNNLDSVARMARLVSRKRWRG